jgi:predicted GIY-YIG superfamily endonuclease
MSNHRYVFIVRCADGSLFTGVTADVERDLRVLNDGGGTPYTRSRLPVFLAHTEEYMNEGDAAKRAAAIKRLPRTAKEDILTQANVGAVGGLAYGV